MRNLRVAIAFGIFLLLKFSVCLSSPQQINSDSSKQFNLSLGANFEYCLKTFHVPVIVGIHLNQHHIYLGPEYMNVLKPLGDPVDFYRKESYGFHLGYRYYFRPPERITSGFMQFSFNCFFTEYTVDPLGSNPIVTKLTVLQNTLSLGFDTKLTSQFSLSGGVGFGSNNSFFLIVDPAVPSAFLGIEYRFIQQKLVAKSVR